MTLGAAVGEAVLGRRIGNRAILWGAVAGTLPDLDVFVPLGDVVSDFTYHRSASHSLFVLALLTPLMAWLISRIHRDLRDQRIRVAIMLYLCFVTHVLLDCFTAYGTQIFWPISEMPVAWATVFIIDPAYTLPLLIGVICALVMTRENDRGHLVNRAGLTLSTAYLAWTIVGSSIATSRFEAELEARQVPYDDMFVTPGPFNTLIWRAVVIDGDGYQEGWYSLFDGDAPVVFTHYPSQRELLTDIADHWPVQRLTWFSHGFYSVIEDAGDIIISDLRMGIEPNYVFRFKVGEIGNPHARPVTPAQLAPVRDLGRLSQLWDRIWNASLPMSPPAPVGAQ